MGFQTLWRANRAVWEGEGRRMLLFKWTLCLASLAGMALSRGLWTTDRGFPTVPILPALPDLPAPACLALAALLAASVVAVGLLPSPGRFALAPPVIGGVLVVFDLNRLQPWAYQYGLMFVALAMIRGDDPRMRRSWGACAAIVACVYLWSGAQKANLAFANEVFPWTLAPFGEGVAGSLQAWWPVVPLLETGVGVLLFFPRTRAFGLAGVVAIHGFVLASLGPFGHGMNSVVWPWNLAMVAMAFVLFWRSDAPVLRSAWEKTSGKAILILVGVLPALSFVGRWDGTLSASLYSGRARDGWIYLTEAGVRALPSGYVLNDESLARESPGRYRLDLARWGLARTNVPPYPEPRVYLGIAERLKRAGVPPGEMRLLVREPVGFEGGREYSFHPLP